MTLPHSAAHAAVFSLSNTRADFLQATLGCFERLGGVPEAMVVDNDSSIVASGVGRKAVPHPEVAALCGQPRDALDRARTGQARVQGTGGTDQRLSRPLVPSAAIPHRHRGHAVQHDAWTHYVAFKRHHRRVGARVCDAWVSERRFLHALPDPLPEVDQRLEVRVQKDGFLRVRGVDYSVPPGIAGRRVQARVCPRERMTSSGSHLEGGSE